MRISNFLLWQAAYSEFVFVEEWELRYDGPALPSIGSTMPVTCAARSLARKPSDRPG